MSSFACFERGSHGTGADSLDDEINISHYLVDQCQTFYQRSGFRCAARLVDFYAPSGDRLIYARTVAQM